MAQDSSRPSVDHADYWQQRYEQGTTGWDIGQAEEPLLDLVRHGELKPGRMLVPGCGLGWEVTAFAELGFDVVGVDFAAAPLAAIRERAAAAGVAVTLLQSDIFALPEAWDGTFDVVLERACYCAIAPEQREAYVKLVARLLKPGGKLAGLFYVPGRDHAGPPFPSEEADIRARFAPAFADIRLLPIEHFFGRLGILTKFG